MTFSNAIVPVTSGISLKRNVFSVFVCTDKVHAQNYTCVRNTQDIISRNHKVFKTTHYFFSIFGGYVKFCKRGKRLLLK